MAGPGQTQTPQQGSRVRRQEVPAASPFSSVLARLPDLSPPRTKYTTSFGSLHPLAASPAPGASTSFGFAKPPSGGAPGSGAADGKPPIAAFDLLAGTPIKGLPNEQHLSSPRFELQLQSPKFPLFQPSPKKPPLDLRSPPSVKHGESSTPGGLRGSFSSPFGSLLDGSSRSAASPADGAAAASGSQHPRQQRFAALFAQAGGALDAAAAALGTGDAPPTGSLDPSYLSPLRPPSSAAAGAAQRGSSGEDEPAGGRAAAGATLHPQGSGEAAPGSSAGAATKDDEEFDDEEEQEEEFSVGSYRRRPPAPQLHRAGAPHTAAVAAQQRLFQPAQRPLRRRTLQFGGDEDELEAAQLVHSTLPQSPACQPVKMDVDMLLPIPKLRDLSSASEDGSGSPSHRLRITYSLDSPAVQAATHAAVTAAMEASNGAAVAAMGAAPGSSRRPARAAAAGAAAAARAAAEAAGTPVARRTSGGLGRTSSSGGAQLSLLPLSPEDDGAVITPGVAPQVVFGGPKKCNCKKSKCLKLYCDCFANGGYCGPACSCMNCANKVENSDVVRAQREAIKQRNPNAFVQKIEADATLGGQHRRGCNCKKSHCMKKYCECFQAGVPCGEHCKCESCHNTVGHLQRRPRGGGGASKRARSGSAAATRHQTRQTARLAAASGSATGLAQLKAAQEAAASLMDAMAEVAGAAGTGSGALPPLLFPLGQPGDLPLMVPVTLQGAGGSSALPPLPTADTAAPALAAFAAAGAGFEASPVGALLGPAAATAAGGGAPAAPAADGFSFRPTSVGPSGSSSGHSTPRAAAGAPAAAAAVADFAFSLDTPGLVGAAAANAAAVSALGKLLPAADAAAAAAAAAAGTAASPRAVTRTPTKRKPLRTMTSAVQ